MCITQSIEFNPEEAPIQFDSLSTDYKRAWNLYLEARNQLIFNPTGTPIGINILAIATLFDFYNIPNYKRASIYEKIVYIYGEVSLITQVPAPDGPKD